jgi:hypothetical protein
VACSVAAVRFKRFNLWLQVTGATMLAFQSVVMLVMRLATAPIFQFDNAIMFLSYLLLTFGLICFAMGVVWEKFTARPAGGAGFPINPD